MHEAVQLKNNKNYYNLSYNIIFLWDYFIVYFVQI